MTTDYALEQEYTEAAEAEGDLPSDPVKRADAIRQIASEMNGIGYPPETEEEIDEWIAWLLAPNGGAGQGFDEHDLSLLRRFAIEFHLPAAE